MEASKVTTCQDERQDLCDDNIQQPEPAPHDNLADQLTLRCPSYACSCFACCEVNPDRRFEGMGFDFTLVDFGWTFFGPHTNSNSVFLRIPVVFGG